MNQSLHTPEGVRDIYNVECGKKLSLENRLHKILQLYGYHDIQTPTLEYAEVFREETGTLPARELYRFFDKEGDTLVLRPDMTPAIARTAATIFKEELLPIRLCYTANTFHNHSDYQGRLREHTQMGAELIGTDSVEADAEMLALAVKSLTSVGLREFQLNVGSIGFFQSLIDDAALNPEAEKQVRSLIDERRFEEVEEYLDSIHVKRSSREALAGLGELYGGVEILTQAHNIAPNSKAIKAIRHLEKVYELLKLYEVESYIRFDFSMQGTYGYYTGILFCGYTAGTDTPIISGGRYDHLIGKFGKETPAIGFALMIDELMEALTRQHVRITYSRKNTLIVYDEGMQKKAIELANDFREKCKNTELLKRKSGTSLDAYMRYGKDYYAGTLIYIEKDKTITMVNLVTGEQKVIHGNH